MSFSFALQVFAVLLLLICIAIAPLVLQRDPVPAASSVHIDWKPHPQWAGMLTQAGLAGFIPGVVLLVACCYLMLD